MLLHYCQVFFGLMILELDNALIIAVKVIDKWDYIKMHYNYFCNKTISLFEFRMIYYKNIIRLFLNIFISLNYLNKLD